MSLRPLLICLLALPVLSCSGTKEQLGLTRRTPDEFAVVQRAPLEMPPDYYLRPPAPGTPRPQEQKAVDQAAQAVLGRSPPPSTTKSNAENVLLQKTNAITADPNIRNVLDAETADVAASQKSTIKRILDIGDSNANAPAPVVDPTAEAARIKANKEAGKPVNTGSTAPLER